MNSEDAAKAGYDAAIRLTDKLARTVWSIYAALVATNAFLVSVVGILVTQGLPWVLAALPVALIGLWVCFVWYRTTARTFAYYSFYFAWARELEGKAFGDVVQVVRDGESFGGSLGKSLVIKVQGADLVMPKDAAQFKVRTLVNSVILAFAFLYLLGLLLGLVVLRG